MRLSVCAQSMVMLAGLFSAAATLRADTLAYATAWSSADASVFGILDINTGAFSPVATLDNTFVADLALSSSGTLYVLDAPLSGSGSLGVFATLNPANGVITDIAPNTAALTSIAFSPTGVLYGISYNPSGPAGLYTVNPGTGSTSLVANLSSTLGYPDVRFLGNTAYVVGFTSPYGLYAVNLSNGDATLIGNTGEPVTLAGVESGQLIGSVIDAGPGASCQLFSVNPLTGAATPGPTTNRQYNFVDIPTSATPEPNSTVVLSAGLALLLWLRTRQRAAR
jgi:hypothetical protein